MNDEAYLRIERMVREVEERVGARGLGEEAVRAFERDHVGRAVMPPRKRLVERLYALERHVLLMDVGVYRRALDTINGVLARSAQRLDRPGDRLDEVGVSMSVAGARAPETFALSNLPDLAASLAALRFVIARILEDDDAFG
jgi:hypothetical protein